MQKLVTVISQFFKLLGNSLIELASFSNQDLLDSE